jgi:hypothetical protein
MNEIAPIDAIPLAASWLLRPIESFVPDSHATMRDPAAFRRRLHAALASLGFAAALLAGRAGAQAAPPDSLALALVRDTGWVENRGTEAAIVASFFVSVPGAEWLRLSFGEIALAGDVARGTGAKLRLVSALDGGTQELNARHCLEWRNSSAYFNGDGVEVEILAEPGTGRSRVVLSQVIVGVALHSLSQCGAADDRVPSSDPRQSRVLPVGCTSWIIDDCKHCLVTAGHCGTGIAVIEFNVPMSTSTGALQHPSPDDQYSPDVTSTQFMNGGLGNDWCYFGCFPNPNTGLTPYQRQQHAYVLASVMPTLEPADTLRITGYGVDTTPPDYNQIQQTATGPFVSASGTVLEYLVDTTGGNSGSPIVAVQSGLAIGIHTNGACTTGGGGTNSGTSIANVNLKNAIAHPLGVCAGPCVASVAVYCSGKVNSQGCTPTIGTAGSPSATGGAGSFTITAGQELNHRTGVLMYGIMSAAQPFMGGTLCIAAPIQRTGAQNSGGNPGASDCSGHYAFDMGARIASGMDANLHVGTTGYAQYWSRDPGSAPFDVGLSDAVAFTIGP